eukprot:738344-Pyramimonas_sp.AAC.1
MEEGSALPSSISMPLSLLGSTMPWRSAAANCRARRSTNWVSVSDLWRSYSNTDSLNARRSSSPSFSPTSAAIRASRLFRPSSHTRSLDWKWPSESLSSHF